jgi:hypothetical protein
VHRRSPLVFRAPTLRDKATEMQAAVKHASLMAAVTPLVSTRVRPPATMPVLERREQAKFMKAKIRFIVASVATACGTISVDSWAQAHEHRKAMQKARFTLFNPTPDRLLREMSTDRPDTTESPYTVDAGHLQFELDLIEYAYGVEGEAATDGISVLSTNFKIGLLNSVDVQFLFTPYRREETDVPGRDQVVDGFGDDTQIRLKINLWGNDGWTPGFGDTAFGIMPFVKFPTGPDELNNGHVEGGLIFPLAATLSGGFDLGLMAEVDFVYNEDADDYGIDFVHTATVSHDIVGELAGYVEYVGVAPHDTGDTYQAISSVGFTYALSRDWMIDFGGTASPSDGAEDYTVFAGTSFRF